MKRNIKHIIAEYQKKLLPVISGYLKNKKVLDVGCGNGLNSFFFNKKCHSKITLLDCEDIRDREVMSFPFIKSSVEKLPFKAASFDVVFLQYVLHHLPRKIKITKVLNELKRVGKLVIIVEEIFTQKTNKQKAKKFDLKINKIIHPFSTMRIYKYYSDKELNNYFNKVNLNIVKKRIIDKGNKEDGFLQRKVYILK